MSAGLQEAQIPMDSEGGSYLTTSSSDELNCTQMIEAALDSRAEAAASLVLQSAQLPLRPLRVRSTPVQLQRISLGWRVSGIVLMLGGFAVCSSSIGIAIGIPAVLLGTAFLLAGDRYKGECPHCERKITLISGISEKKCHVCRRPVVLKSGRFYTLDAL